MKNLVTDRKGQVLPLILIISVVLMILVPATVLWVQTEARQTVKEHRSTVAFNLAEAGIDRGMWKLKSSTATWDAAYGGIPIPGYNFDRTYSDVPGGYYRIKFSTSAGPGRVAIIAEGKDASTEEIRSIRAVYRNQCIPGAMIAGGVLTWANAFSAQWGPIMAQNNINITDANAAKDYFPRKFSRQVVKSNSGGYARDLNGLDPPNTDNVEWWSDYDVPDLPIPDFTALRSSAAASGTLNVYGCKKTGASWDKRSTCSSSGGGGGKHSRHFGNPWRHPKHLDQCVWYWDNDVELIGSTGNDGCGIYGTIIVRGNLTLNVGDNYAYTGPVPSAAWQEYAKITKTTGDTSAKNQYPADDGFQKNRSTFRFGNETWSGGPAYYNTDVGIRGFVYVGGNLDIKGPLDINGAVWVVGNVMKATGSERCVIFFDDTLQLPSLNVVLVRESWKEIQPSPVAWQ